ncbi:MAG: phycobilisome rod-core linker polypeptide [Cyanobacteria bacterium P01_F01_bin.33]
MTLWVTTSDPVELRPQFTEDDLQIVIRAAYRQVLGNQHILENDRLANAESMLRNGSITVRGFVEMVANSDLYRSLFFESNPIYRFIELNFKHFLGRPPADQAEVSEHVQIYNTQGYEAEISSYMHSYEYLENFSENLVPYARSTQSLIGSKNSSFNRTFALLRGSASSDSSSKAAKLISDLAANLPTQIATPAGGSGSYDNTGKRFRITVAKPGVGNRFRRSKMIYEINYSQMNARIRSIHKSGGTILSIDEVA